MRRFTWLIQDDEPQSQSQPQQPQTEIFSSAADIQLDTDPTPRKKNKTPPDPDPNLAVDYERYVPLPVSFVFRIFSLLNEKDIFFLFTQTKWWWIFDKRARFQRYDYINHCDFLPIERKINKEFNFAFVMLWIYKTKLR